MPAGRYDSDQGYLDAPAKASKWFDKAVLSRGEGLGMNGIIPTIASLFPFA